MPTRRVVLGMLAASPALTRHGSQASGDDLARAALRQVGVTTQYDHGYRRIAYPGGDVPRVTGVCADVIVRAARDAWNIDLQRLVHEDMLHAFAAYPTRWGLHGPDSNIDHRRVPNLETYWNRRGARLWHAASRSWGFDFHGGLQPGDVLTWRTFLTGGPHVAIVVAGGRWPRIVQNHGWGAREDLLAIQWLDAAEAHYRWRPVL